MSSGTITLGDGRTVCLGVVPEDIPIAAPSLAPFVGDTSLLPLSVDYSPKAASVLTREFLNKTQNTCVIASMAHLVGLWTGNDRDSGGLATINDADIAAHFAAWCGPEGCISTNIFVYAHTQGLLFGGKRYTVDGYVLVTPFTPEMVKAAIYLLGGVAVTVNLPDSWRMASDGGVWDVPDSKQVIGTHQVMAYGYDSDYAKVCTWGETRLVTWEALLRSTGGLKSEWGTRQIFGVLSPSWYGPDGVAPSLLDLPALREALKNLGAGLFPTLPPLPPSPVLGPWTVATKTDPDAKLHVKGLKPHPNIVVAPQIPASGMATPPANFEEWVRAVVRDELGKHESPAGGAS